MPTSGFGLILFSRILGPIKTCDTFDMRWLRKSCLVNTTVRCILSILKYNEKTAAVNSKRGTRLLVWYAQEQRFKSKIASRCTYSLPSRSWSINLQLLVHLKILFRRVQIVNQHQLNRKKKIAVPLWHRATDEVTASGAGSILYSDLIGHTYSVLVGPKRGVVAGAQASKK